MINTSMRQLYLVIGISCIYLSLLMWTQWGIFSVSYPLIEYERRYSESQYVKGDQKTFEMGDGDIYTFAGIRYVQGEDPTKINFEHPPLIKYLFGLSYLVFGMPNWSTVPLFFLAVISFWYLSAYAVKTTKARFLALFLFLGHSTIYMAIPQTMLDFPMTAILLFDTALFIRLQNKPTIANAIQFGVVAGLLLVTKYPFPLLAIYVGLLFAWLLMRKMNLKYILFALTSLCAAYVLSYMSYFFHGNSLISFLKFEWWRWQWFQGKTDSQKFMLLQTIFLGRYPKWWNPQGGYVYVAHWNFMWPMTLIIYLGSWLNRQKYVHEPLFPYKLWILIALCLYMLGAAEDRFLVPLIPGFALFGAKFVENIVRRQKSVL